MAPDPATRGRCPRHGLLLTGRRVPPSCSTAGRANGTPRWPPFGWTAGWRQRDAAFAPHRLEDGLRPNGTPRWPPSGSTAGFALSPTPPQGGSDTCSLRGFSYSPQIIPPLNPPHRPVKHSSITPPLRGSRRSPSRMAKASAVGGSHKASQRRDLVRRHGFARAKLKAKACAPSRVRTDQVTGDGRCPGGNAGPRLRQHSHLG